MWHETMSSPERMGALMRGERPDRVPVIPFIFGHTALMCGEPLARVFDDAEQSYRCQVLCQEMYGYDGGPLYAYASAGGWELGGRSSSPTRSTPEHRSLPGIRSRVRKKRWRSKCPVTSLRRALFPSHSESPVGRRSMGCP